MLRLSSSFAILSPGPIVLDKNKLLTYCPFAEEGLILIIVLRNAFVLSTSLSDSKFKNKSFYSEQKILCEKFKSQVINFQIIVIFKFCKSFSVGYVDPLFIRFLYFQISKTTK